jgi:hypothetical protein
MIDTLPRHIKSIVEEDMGRDDMGTPYSRVTVTFRWWYRPIAWWYARRLPPIEDEPGYVRDADAERP